MILINKISDENLEALAGLWSNKDFQILVKLLKKRRENLAWDCLAREADIIQINQIEARLINNLIKAVEEASKKVEAKEKTKK